MQVLGVRGQGGDALERTVDRLVARLEREGRVGVVRNDGTLDDGAFPAERRRDGAVTYALGADGDWTAAGSGLDVSGALERLATDCDYAVVVGAPSLGRPTVVVGEPLEEGATETDPGAGADADSDAVLARVDEPADLELESIVDALADAEPYETLESLVARVKRSSAADRAGAVATFTGRVRAKDGPDDPRTEYLEFEKYEGVADRRLAAIERELEAREGVYAVAVHHRTGVVRDGEDIVFVVALAGHRGPAFRAVEDGIDRLKEEVPLFKKEVTVEDEYWVHDRS